MMTMDSTTDLLGLLVEACDQHDTKRRRRQDDVEQEVVVRTFMCMNGDRCEVASDTKFSSFADLKRVVAEAIDFPFDLFVFMSEGRRVDTLALYNELSPNARVFIKKY